MTSILNRFIYLLIGVTQCAVLARGQVVDEKEVHLGRMLRDANFGSRFPLESELVNKYGRGLVERPYREETWHTYYLPDTSLWLRCKIDANRTILQPLTEILVSRLPLADRKIAPETRIGQLELKGVHIGQNVAPILKRWGPPFRSEAVRLNGITTTAYEYFPSGATQGTLLSLFVRHNIVVAFSLSSPE